MKKSEESIGEVITDEGEEPVSKVKDIFNNCLKSDEEFILPKKISGNINCEKCLYSRACASGKIKACIIDSKVWHNSSEEPIEDKQTLVCVNGFYYVEFYHKDDKRFYMFEKPKLYLRNVDRWAYIEDIVNLICSVSKISTEEEFDDLREEMKSFPT